MKAYVARRNADTTEGRGPMIPDAYFLNKKDAEAHIDPQEGVMGRKAPSGRWSQERYGDWDIVEVEVHASLSEFQENRERQLREEALASLTPRQRRALGFPES